MSKSLITEVSIYPIKPKNGLVSFASCVFNGQLSLNSIAIYTRPDGDGYRLVYPIKMLPNGRQVNLFYPINKETADMIYEAVIEKYKEVSEKAMKRMSLE